MVVDRYSVYARDVRFLAEIAGVAVIRGGENDEIGIFGLDAVTGEPLWRGDKKYRQGLGRPVAKRKGLLWWLSPWYLSVLDPKTGVLLARKEFGFSAVYDFTCVDVDAALFWDDAVVVIEQCRNVEGGPGHRFHYYKIVEKETPGAPEPSEEVSG